MSTYARPGDVLSRRKGLVMHKGVALGNGRVLHNTPFHGEHICSEAEFRAGKRMYVQSADAPARHRAMRHARAHDRHAGAAFGAADRGYNLLTNNCEHTVTRATTGRAHSPQLRSWVAGTTLAVAAFALTRHPAVAAAGYALGRRLARRRDDR